MKEDKVFSEYLNYRNYLEICLRQQIQSLSWYNKGSEELDIIDHRIKELEKRIVILDHKLFTTHKVFVRSRSIWKQLFKSHLSDNRPRVLRKDRIPYLRKIYCVYRLYKGYHISIDQIDYILGLDTSGKRRYINRTMLQKLIGEAFKRECMKESCFAKPFFEDPEYIPPSLLEK